MPTRADWSVKQVRQVKLGEAIVNQLLAALGNGVFEPGDRLPSEPVLAEKLGVSRVTLREAIKVLDTMGLIEVRRGRGTFVKARTPSSLTRPVAESLGAGGVTVLELLDARRLIELETVNRACARRTDDDLTILSRIVDEMAEEAENPERYVDLDAAFHLRIAGAARNRVLVFALRTIREHLREALLKTVSRPSRPRTNNQEHRELLAAIRTRDGVSWHANHGESLEKARTGSGGTVTESYYGWRARIGVICVDSELEHRRRVPCDDARWSFRPFDENLSAPGHCRWS